MNSSPILRVTLRVATRQRRSNIETISTSIMEKTNKREKLVKSTLYDYGVVDLLGADGRAQLDRLDHLTDPD